MLSTIVAAVAATIRYDAGSREPQGNLLAAEIRICRAARRTNKGVHVDVGEIDGARAPPVVIPVSHVRGIFVDAAGDDPERSVIGLQICTPNDTPTDRVVFYFHA